MFKINFKSYYGSERGEGIVDYKIKGIGRGIKRGWWYKINRKKGISLSRDIRYENTKILRLKAKGDSYNLYIKNG